ncbi:helicase-related protein [Microvirga solisilvae]|uniref:helicase-related protein n=1 Tax=Microvirga solisilvae TaxID=2919498 RepID=UPI001FAE7679|nr:helicase-related protein [Microvirga solisilvae]
MVRRSLPPQVRARGVTAVLGPTNTGKTHLAIERMLGHDSGMIGLPLRLLAREVYSRVVEKAGHHNVALITGEEKIKPDKPRYWISTVEAMPRDVDASFVAIDEIQLASDLDRGHVFTDRLLNQRGRQETLLIGSMTMRPLIEALIPGVHVVTRPRLSQLTFAGEKKVSRLPRRSAIVAFSAEEVYGIAELIRRQSGGAAVVLGALSPRTRNAQVELYQNGDVDYLIATDAIGMGLNLDVDHVAFASDKKFDGFRFRKLYNPELAQIAGRAGRYMRDGTFGSTGRCPPFDAETVEALENHTFDPVRILQWRNPDLDFSSLGRLRDSLGVQPREHGLVRAPTGEDVASLEILAREDDIQAFARTPYAVERLWQMCQVPDYRKVSPQTHADLIGQLYRFLMKDGAIPAEWFSRHLSASDRTDGDIDTLSNRIAQVRTWSFVANRPDWLKDPEHWQGVARRVEDKLSDALHERLAQRFIDRRTSVLMRRLRENTMLEAEITTTGDVTVEGQHIGHLHGFHFVPDPQADTTEAKTLRNAASKALAGEIEARADRFAETPDTTLVLSNDGTVRWMGDPVAKLEPGDKLFEPRVRILSDEHLTGPARDKVDNRLRAWLKAYVVRLLGPAMDIETNAEITGLARGIAFQIGEAIGVLERAKVLNEVRSLDQDSRAALRKAGVRFGAYHLYLPALLKPAPRVLATQLWALQNGGLDQKGIDEIAHLAQSGRTSIPVDPEIAAGLYRAAGFRVCGGRAVRVDILERLADLIRPAISYRPGITPGEPPAGAADGDSFVPTVAMTSLVGCAGEDFATILKSLGYVMERRQGPAITVPLIAAASTEPAAEASAETPAPAEETGAATVSEAVAIEAVEASAAEAVASPEGAAAEGASEAPTEPETIEVWRQHRRHHEGGQARQGREARGPRGERPERGDRRPRHGEGQGERPRREAQGEGGREGGRPQNRPPRGPRPDDRRGPRPDKRADNRRDGGGQERREKQPDPNSPFAKLMALKAQMEDGKK